MTKTLKDKLLTITLSAVTTLMIGIILLSFTNLGESKKDITKKLNQKLDKTEYQIDCESVNLRLSKKVDNKVFEAYIKAQDKNYEAIIRIDDYIKTLH